MVVIGEGRVVVGYAHRWEGGWVGGFGGDVVVEVSLTLH